MLSNYTDKCLNETPNFMFDEACLDIDADVDYRLFSQHVECLNCKFQEWTKRKSYLIDTNFESMFVVKFDNTTCMKTMHFDEHARYGWNITQGNCSDIYVKEPGENSYLPILESIIAFICFATIWYMIKWIYKNRYNILNYFNNDPTCELPSAVEQPKDAHPARIKSVDAFRGLCITVMIFVNYGGGQYWFFRHTAWNGLTVADLIFPSFLWVMGFSITLSLRARLSKGVSRRKIARQIIKRACILIVIGLVLNSHGRDTNLETLRFPGVLQRLGITYLIVGLLEIMFIKDAEDVKLTCIEDITVAWPQWMTVLCLVFIHTFVTFLLPVPNCPTGYLGPGGLHNHPLYENCTGGAAGYIDRFIFGNHMYFGGYDKTMYNNKLRHDPEGLLGTLTAVFTVYLGVQAGRIIFTYSTVSAKVFRWLAWSVVTGLIAGVLCNFSKNDGIIPVNKRLWSLSFVLALASMAFFIESILFLLVDVTRKWGGRPFIYPGMNSILLYVGQDIARTTIPFAWTPMYNTHRSYLVMNLWGTILWVVISVFLYKKNIFCKI